MINLLVQILFLSRGISGQDTDCPPLVADGVQFAGKLIPEFRGPTGQIIDYDKCIYPGKSSPEAIIYES